MLLSSCFRIHRICRTISGGSLFILTEDENGLVDSLITLEGRNLRTRKFVVSQVLCSPDNQKIRKGVNVMAVEDVLMLIICCHTSLICPYNKQHLLLMTTAVCMLLCTVSHWSITPHMCMYFAFGPHHILI